MIKVILVAMVWLAIFIPAYMLRKWNIIEDNGPNYWDGSEVFATAGFCLFFGPIVFIIYLLEAITKHWGKGG